MSARVQSARISYRPGSYLKKNFAYDFSYRSSKSRLKIRKGDGELRALVKEKGVRVAFELESVQLR